MPAGLQGIPYGRVLTFFECGFSSGWDVIASRGALHVLA